MVMTDDKQREKRSGGRDPYEPPTLVEFGPVGELTQSGSVGMMEGTGGGPDMFP